MSRNLTFESLVSKRERPNTHRTPMLTVPKQNTFFCKTESHERAGSRGEKIEFLVVIFKIIRKLVRTSSSCNEFNCDSVRYNR